MEILLVRYAPRRVATGFNHIRHRLVGKGKGDCYDASSVCCEFLSRRERIVAEGVVKEFASQPMAVRAKLRYEPPSFIFQPVRTRLHDSLLLEVSSWPRVLSVVAPIGYGKTVLMSELYSRLEQADRPVFWVGLDDRDADLERVLGAIESCLGHVSSDVVLPPVLLPGYGSVEHRVEALLETLSRLPAGSVLFIDNLNSCTDPALACLLDALIFRAPSSVRFVWSSSVRLPFNYARAKLQGLVHQIGFTDLSLNRDEARQLLGQDIGEQIGSLGIDALLQQTEGWPAAIRMAQIVLADSDQPLLALESFSGSDEDIAALLNRHVLQTFSPELKAFILSLAPLRVFTADLARAASGNERAEEHIDFLLRKNVFIISLDRQRKWYRLHGLFRTYLQGEAERHLTVLERKDALCRAAVWCERVGEWRDAIEYALAAEAGEVASRILEQTAILFVRDQGDIQQYIRWLEALQGKGVPIGWEAHYWYVWALIFSRRYDYGRQQHQRLSERMCRQMATGVLPPENMPQRMAHLRICIGLFTDDMTDARQRADQWLTTETTGDPFNVASISCMKSICLTSAFQFAEARHAMQVAEPILQQVQSAYSTGWANLINATLLSYQGDYRAAYAGLTLSLNKIRTELGDDAGICGTTALVTAQCAIEMGLDAEARDYLALGLRTAHSHGLVDTAASGFDAAIKLWTGADDELVALSKLREIATSYPPRLSWMLSCHLIRRLLHLERPHEAMLEAERLGLETAGPDAPAVARYQDLFEATEIDLAIASGDLKRARRLIGDVQARASKEGRVARQLELILAQARIEARMDHPGQARKSIALAVGKAARRRIVRPFIDHAGLIAELINHGKSSAWSLPIGEERDFFDAICRHPAIAERLDANRPNNRSFDPGMVDMPTKREIGILHLMDLGLSNQQVADHEHVSVTTIKWHLQNMYRKLGVNNRAAALARARALGLLTR